MMSEQMQAVQDQVRETLKLQWNALLGTRAGVLAEIAMQELEDAGPAAHRVSITGQGEHCGMCLREGTTVVATHKVGEEIPDDLAPVAGHNLTQYVCCRHFARIMGFVSASLFRGCRLDPLAIARERSVARGDNPANKQDA